MKFESDCTKRIVSIMPSIFYEQIVEVDIDLLPCDLTPKEFILSSETTYM